MFLDWTTGDDSDVELQIPVYALYCRTVLGLPFRDGEASPRRGDAAEHAELPPGAGPRDDAAA